jgi:hypothetical protein
MIQPTSEPTTNEQPSPAILSEEIFFKIFLNFTKTNTQVATGVGKGKRNEPENQHFADDSTKWEGA